MKTSYLYIALVVLLIGGLVLAKQNAGPRPVVTENKGTPSTPIDQFAQCLTDAGAKFYGAFWCPHCQAQKKLFENSKFLPYVECSLPDGKTQNKTCNDQNITGYPTWIFADGTRGEGEQTFQELSQKTNCPVPASS